MKTLILTLILSASAFALDLAPSYIKGRVTDPIGRGIPRTLMRVQEAYCEPFPDTPNAVTRYTYTTTFGYYWMEVNPECHAYSVRPFSKKFGTFDWEPYPIWQWQYADLGSRTMSGDFHRRPYGSSF